MLAYWVLCHRDFGCKFSVPRVKGGDGSTSQQLSVQVEQEPFRKAGALPVSEWRREEWAHPLRIDYSIKATGFCE